MPTPSKFTADRRQAILEARQYGASLRTAAAEAAIDHETLRHWLARGEKAEPGTPYRDFYEAFEQATGHPKMRALRAIYKAVPDDVQTAKWVLERTEDGYSPPQVRQPAVPQGPMVIALTFHDGRAVPQLGGGTVIEVGEASGEDSTTDPAGA